MTSPRWKPRFCASEPSATSSTTTPSADGIEPQFVGERRREIGDLDAHERRARADHDLLARRLRRGLRARSSTSLLAAAQHAELRGAAERLGGEAVVERIRIVDRLAVDRHDQVAGLQARARRRALWRDARDQRAGGPLSPMLSAMSGVTACSLAPSHGRFTVVPPPLRRGDHHLAPCWRGSRSRCPASRPSARRSRC